MASIRCHILVKMLEKINPSGDHIVGWANSSVRHPDELPDLGDVRQAKGVVRGDPVGAALASNEILPHPAAAVHREKVSQPGIASLSDRARRIHRILQR